MGSVGGFEPSSLSVIPTERIPNFVANSISWGIAGKMPIYIDLDGYLHIYMRHVEEMKVNSHFEHKDNFQWNEDDVFMVMEKIIQKINDEIQSFFESNIDQKYSRYGEQSVYFEGDYYTFHIDSNGRIIAFYKNRKEHEKPQS